MTFIEEEFKDITIFRLKGSVNIETIKEFNKRYTDLIKQNRFKFVFNLTDVTFIDSSGLGTIIIGMSAALKNKTKLKICGIHAKSDVDHLFKTTRMNIGMDFYETEEEAVNSF